MENSHYSTSCAQHFTIVVNNWGICENTLQHADNSRNVIAAVTTLRLSICQCAAHSLQLSVKKALDESGVEAVLYELCDELCELYDCAM